MKKIEPAAAKPGFLQARHLAPLGLFIGMVLVNVLLRMRFEIVVNDVTCVRVRTPFPLTDIPAWLLNRGDLFYRPIEFWLQFAEWEAFGTNWLPGIIIHAVMLGFVAVLTYYLVMEVTRGRVGRTGLRVFIASTAAILFCTSFRLIEVTWLIFQKSMLTELYVLSGLLGYLLYQRTGKSRWLIAIVIPGILGPLTRELPASLAAVILVLTIFTSKRDFKLAVMAAVLAFHAVFPVFLPSLLLGDKLNMYALFGQGMSRGLLVQGDTGAHTINFDLPFRAALFYSPVAIILLFASIAIYYFARKDRLARWAGGATILVLLLSLAAIYLPGKPVLSAIAPILFSLAICVPTYRRYGLFLPAFFIVPIVPFLFVPVYDVWVRLPALAFIIMALLWTLELAPGIRAWAGKWVSSGLLQRRVPVRFVLFPAALMVLLVIFQIPNLAAAELTNRKFIETHKEIAGWFTREVPRGSALISNLRQTFDIDWYSGQHVIAYYAPFTPPELPPIGPMPGGRGEPVLEVLDRLVANPDTPVYLVVNEAFGRLGLPDLPLSELKHLTSFEVNYNYPVLDPLQTILRRPYVTFYGPTDLGFQQAITPGFETNVKCTFDIYQFTGTYASFKNAYERIPAASAHVPRPWGRYLGFNIIADGPTLYAISALDGGYDPERVKIGAYNLLFTGRTMKEIEEKIDNYSHAAGPQIEIDNYHGMTILGAYGTTYGIAADEILSDGHQRRLSPDGVFDNINANQYSAVLRGNTIGDVINMLDSDPRFANFPNLLGTGLGLKSGSPADGWETTYSQVRQDSTLASFDGHSLKISADKREVVTLLPNLLTGNTDFEAGDPPQGWNTFDARIARESNAVKAGKFSLKVTANKSRFGDAGASQNVFKPEYRGRTFTFGAWVMAPATNDKTQTLGIWDGVSVKYSEPVPHDGKWHWITVNKTLDEKATELRTYTYVLTGNEPDTDDVLYVDSALLYEGVSPPVLAGASQDVFKPEYRGRTFSFGAWVMAPATNDKTQTLGIWDGVSVKYSEPVPHDGKWHWVTVTKTLEQNATELRAYACVLNGGDPDSDDVLYLDSAVLISNLITSNPDFESTNPLEGWVTFDCRMQEESTFVMTGKHSLKLTASKSKFGDAGANQNVFQPEYRGHTFTFGAWAMAPASNDKMQSIGIWDGVSVSYSPLIPHDGQWHWVTVTKTLDRKATELRPYAYVLTANDPDSDDVLYVDSLVLIPGDYLPALPEEE